MGRLSGAARRRLRIHLHADHRLLPPRRGDAGPVGCLLRRLPPHHPAGLAARLFRARLYQPHDALLHAERNGAGIYRRRPRQGPVGKAHHMGPRAAQRRGADGHGDRALLRQPARRLGADRNRLLLAGHRALHHQLVAERRHECGARRHHHHRLGVHRHQPSVRPALPASRSKDQGRMSRGIALSGLAAANHPHSDASGHLSPGPGERKSWSHAWRLSSPPSNGGEGVCEAVRSGCRQLQEASS
ncbi:hypothetical protein MPLB_250095 [Mesorhizobium sp. ORS 3324]|nr:hypothetical protein MPLB_250095 [Mesorhizobium sp. ORS 3324]